MKLFPSKEFVERANVRDAGVYERAERDPLGFWAEAAERVHWFREWKEVLDTSRAPFYRWFTGGEINISYNCLDRHLKERGSKPALVWEGEDGTLRSLSYSELHREVCVTSSMLRELGVERGDRVVLYMGMVPELPVAMLACARIGAVHSVVFGGFSPRALADRIRDADPKVVITQDGAFRRGRVVPLKQNVDEALESAGEGVERVVVLERAGNEVSMREGRDVSWEEARRGCSAGVEPVPLDSEHPLFILYTSGTTGKPKGVLHVHGGYNVGVHLTANWVFDLKEEDVYWCTADIGWITGHSYVVYGPLSNGATVVMYEGAPDYPTPERWWEIIERHGVTVFYTAPTAIRFFMRLGEEPVRKHELGTLRLLGSVGEPINPRAWLWFYEVVGERRCPIVDTWWQTETGMVMITTLPGVDAMKPGCAGRPFPGVRAMVVDENMKPAARGELVITAPWPAMLRTLWRNEERYLKTYFRGEVYVTGDGARVDEEGSFWILGRVDDVLNVSGHRLGTAELESALVSHPSVAEAAVVGREHEVKGQAIVAFVVLRDGVKPSEELVQELRAHVAREISPIAKPDEVHFVSKLPKTRSGKIMRRVMRAIEQGGEIGDLSTLEDVSAVEEVKRA